LGGGKAQHDRVQKLRFLIAEDSAPMRSLIRSLVEDFAAEVVECEGGREAVRLYFETRPDWVLMDLHIADGDGLEATRAIRDRDGSARIVIVTQFDENALRRACEDAGAVAYMLCTGSA
jgi:CheY-like chemotaxis protein